MGRDNAQAHKHYYRQWRLRPDDDYGTWTSWEEIATPIDSGHVVVFVHAGDVHLAWPSFSKNASELRWTVSMNLARRNVSGWTKLKKGRGELSCPMLPNKNESRSFAFRFVPETLIKPVKPASIECYAMTEQWITPLSPESQFTQIGSSDKPEADGITEEDPPWRRLFLQVRVLTKYKDPTGTMFFKFADKAKVTATLGFLTIVGSKVGYILYDLHGSPSEFSREVYLKTWLSGPISSAVSNFLFIGLEATIIDTGTSTEYKKMVLKSEFHLLDQDAEWNIDFIFEINETLVTDTHLKLGIYRRSPLSLAGNFQLMDDDSFTLKTVSIAATLELPPEGTEDFDSGYQEIPAPPRVDVGIGETLDRAFSIGGSQIFPGTPGKFFSIHTGHVSAQEDFWAYRDDAVHVLLWRKSPEELYRLVPMDITGTTELRRAVAKAGFASADRLPETLPNALIAATNVDTGWNKESSIFKNLPSSSYYWEVCFHNLLLIATQLSQAQRFEEAQRWFHLIFDPTTNDAAASPSRYWRFLPFRERPGHPIDELPIDELLQELAQGHLSLRDQINEWAENPFRPHLVAKHRLRSYQFAVVEKYLENLIAWGDQLFRRDTIEAINEATQMYVLATKILGKRPASSPKSKVIQKSYRDLQSKLDDLSNAWEPLEAITATQRSSAFMKRHERSDQPSIDVLNSLRSLYFCIPSNEKLSGYWDAVEDRLFKIRHCMNIEGIERQLPLFEPPIDPALLVRATAAGLDLAAVFSDLQAPLPLYRFNVMLPKALELCSEVRALGNALVSALEKKDAEQLSLLRSSHEIHMLKLVRVIKVQQQEEAETNLEALRKTREITLQRYLNYQRLLGKQNIVMPAEGSAAVLESSSLMLAPAGAGGGDTQGLALIPAEAGQLGWLNDANNFSIVAGILNALGGASHLIPDTHIHSPFVSVQWRGSHIGAFFNSLGTVSSTLASNASFQANRSSIMGGHQRRYDEWRFQSNTAAKELEQIDKQILANEIRIQMAEGEIANHDQQITNTHEVDAFMRDKFTNQQLYSWMVGQISSVYFRTYQLAHDMSKRVERTYRFELGLKDKDSSFIEFGYWDSLKKGLLSGERLYLDLKRMEAAYLDKNTREYEITKHVSLLQLAPVALLQLKETGQCEMSIPEDLFDMDFPGHYLRRIKSVSLTIPCVAGPYATVPCTLTLLKHSVRHSNSVAGNFARDIENDDPRFIDSFGASQSIVTSTAQNDSGLFETNLRDERYLPFEGKGTISNWRLELPSKFRPFNYATISDVILHLRYTAREGGDLLKTGAVNNIDDLFKNAEAAGWVRLFSMRHEFPTEWAMFQSARGASTTNAVELKINLKPEHYPFWAKERLKKVARMDLFANPTKDTKSTITVYDKADNTPEETRKDKLVIVPALGHLRSGELKTVFRPATPIGAFSLYFDDNSMEDLWLALAWKE